MPEAPDRILLVLVAGIGDVVMATPAIRAIRRGLPASRLTLLTTPQAAGLARPCPYLDEVKTFALRAFRPGERGMGVRGWRAFRDATAHLRSQRFDLAVNLFRVASLGGAIRMALFFARIAARRTAGRWSGGRGIIFGLRSSDRPHEVDAMLALATALGLSSEGDCPELWIPDASRRSAATRLQAVGLGASTPYAVLNVGSNKPEARLPIEKAAEIGRVMRRETGLYLLVTGDASEIPQAEALSGQIGEAARSLAGKTDLLELAAILEHAKVVVSTDTGPMHIASAMGAPLVVLYGPGDPARSGPRGRTGQVVILQGKARPRDPSRWHEDLSADEAIEAALQLLTTRTG